MSWSHSRGIRRSSHGARSDSTTSTITPRATFSRRVFLQQMELAASAKLPIIIHCRPSDNSENAWDDTLRLIRENWASTGLGGVMHCFTGTVEHARAALDLGFVISFAGNITYPKAQNIRDAASMVPLDQMFIETDSPYLAPVPHRGKRNEPAFVREVASQIGQLRGLPAEEIGAITTANFHTFSRLPQSQVRRCLADAPATVSNCCRHGRLLKCPWSRNGDRLESSKHFDTAISA